MKSDHDALRQVVSDILADNIEQARAEASKTGFSSTLWTTLGEGGFTTVIVPTDTGGAGGTLVDLATVLRTCGYHAAPVPLAETNAAAVLLARAGLDIPLGPLAITDIAEQPDCQIVGPAGSRRLVGVLHAVPWAAQAQRVVVAVQDVGQAFVGALSPADQVMTPAVNIAGEPTADVSLDGGVRIVPLSEYAQPVPNTTARELVTLARCLLITGSMRRVLALSARYSRDREQFGRSIGSFQAVAHQLAQLAGAVEQADAIVDATVTASSAGQPVGELMLAAKVCTGQAAGLAIRIGHQIHGAIGVTEEFELHHHTRRLMAWRDQGGSEVTAARLLGRHIAENGGRRLWELMTYQPDNPTRHT
ncbi:MAG: acyl-CoA dehydrogenase family protein [Gaiellales bacterium]